MQIKLILINAIAIIDMNAIIISYSNKLKHLIYFKAFSERFLKVTQVICVSLTRFATLRNGGALKNHYFC